MNTNSTSLAALCSLVLAGAAALPSTAAAQPAFAPASSATPGTARAAPLSALSQQVVGGTPASDGEFPFAAFVEWDAGDGYVYICTGSVVSPTLILTAAHCVTKDDGTPVASKRFEVITGRANLGDLGEGQVSAVSQVSIEPGWRAGHLVNDLATLTLAQPVSAPAVRLASYADMSTIGPGANVQVLGWGQTHDHQTALQEQLMTASVTLQSEKTCWQASTWFHPGSMLCSDVPGHGVAPCHGDSGGPMLAQTASGEWVEAGMVDFGSYTSCTDGPSFYQSAAAASWWLAPQLGQTPDSPPLIAAPAEAKRPYVKGHSAPGGVVHCMNGAWTGAGLHFRYTWTYDGRLLRGITAKGVRIPSSVRSGQLRCSVIVANDGGMKRATSATVRIHPAS
jgi:hypothetical protein